jgi:hypothetical protein
MAIAAPALADDLTISTNTSAAVASLTAANGAPGNITISTSGSVAIGASGAAVTLNSNNSVVNSGTISNTTDASGVGIQITAGNTGSVTNNGTINIPSNATPSTATGQFGIVLSGTGVFTGNVIAGSGSNITVSGISSNAIAIQSELSGNLTVGGTITASGSLSNGVLTSAPTDGTFINTATIMTARGAGTAMTLSPGSPIAIGGNVAGGFLNAGPVSSTDTTPAATLSTVGAAPALIVAPSIGVDVADLTLGIAPDANNPGFSILNRGNIIAVSDQPGISSSTFQIGDAIDNTSGKLTVLTGGVYNAGTISATATSDAPGVPSSSSTATAFIIGNLTTVPALTNDARGTISAAAGGTVGGNAVGLLIQTGGSLATLNNSGSITSSATASVTAISSLSAIAINDMTGTLIHINNSGTISATATALDAGGQRAVAANLSAATSAISFVNSGTVTGDILFGNASGNQLSIDGAHAIVAGNIQAFGVGTVNVAVSNSGTGGTLQTSHLTGGGTLSVGPGGTLDLGVGANTPVVATSGAISFDAASHLVLTPVSLLPNASVTLIHSDAGISFGNFAATTAGIQVPFLFSGSLSADAKNVVLSLSRKTAGQLGLTGNAAAIYEPALDAALTDGAFGGALSTLSNTADVQSAIEQLLPVTSSANLAVVETLTDSSTDAIGTRQRSLLLAPASAAGFSMWGQGLYGLFHGSDEDSYSGHGIGGVVGFDYAQPAGGHFGIALTIYDAELHENSPLTAKTDAKSYLISPYMGFRIQDFFIDAQLNAGESSVQTTRTVNVGSVTRVATGKPDEMLASGGISGGYIWNLGFIQLIPQASLNGVELYDHSYTESGGGTGADLMVDSHHESSLRSFIGLTAGGTYQAGDARLVPQLTAGWSQDLLTGSPIIDASFASVPLSNFEVTGLAPSRSRFIAGAGFDFVEANWSIGLNYSATISSSALAQSAGLVMSARF